MPDWDDDYRAYYTDEELAETPAERMSRLGAERATKTGSCPKCGKPLKPRGQHFHIRSCKG